MKISIAIVTRDRAATVARTLRELDDVAVPCGVDVELLVVDNGSSDQTAETVKRVAPTARLIIETAVGQPNARNRALAAATGDVLVWIDDDASPSRQWLEAIVNAMKETSAQFVFGPSEPDWPDVPPSWYSARFRGYFALLDYGPARMEVTSFDTPFFGLNLAGTVEAHRTLGGFDTSLSLVGGPGAVNEDVDLYRRALTAGMRIVYDPGIRVRHRIQPERVAKRYHRRRHAEADPLTLGGLSEQFRDVPWFCGLPRFMYRRAAENLIGYLMSSLARDEAEAFYHELQVRRFYHLAITAWSGDFGDGSSGRVEERRVERKGRER